MHKIIFTDCFNTIILRKNSDKEVLFNWCEKLGKRYDIEPTVLYHFFSKYKTNLGIKAFFKTGEAEIKLDCIITKLVETLNKNIANLDLVAFKKDALSLYILAESESHYLNEPFVERLKNFKKEGSKIYVLSEFYCGKEVLAEWLKKLGIDTLFEDIFVSCDYSASKRSSRLYKKVVRELGANKRDIIMFGDNRCADILGARCAGIKAKRIVTKIAKTPKDFKKIKLFGSDYKKFEEIFNRYGDNYTYSNHAFPLFLFTRRLFIELKKRGVKNVFFLSREGLFIKNLFDKYATCVGGGELTTHYLQVSRNALYRVVLKPLEKQDFSYLLQKYSKMSLHRFLNSLAFSEQEIKDIGLEIGEKIHKKRAGFDKTEAFAKLKKNSTFQKIYESKRKEQEGVFDSYLQSFGVDFTNEGLHVVDVGWRGSMQDLLSIHLEDVKVYGYYVGYLKIAFEKNYVDTRAKSKYGLLHHAGKKEQLCNSCFKPIFCDYEQICRAPHNCVYGYKIQDDKVQIVYEDKIDEKALHKKYILPLQQQIEDKFKDLCKLEYRHLSVIEPLSIIRHMDIYRKLSRHDVDFYINGINSHFDNFGRVGIPEGSSTIKRIGFKAADFLLKIRFMRYSKRRIFRQFYKKIEKGTL